MNYLHAISPLDGRYSQHVSSLQYIFSEFALISFRTEVEIKYLLFLMEQTGLVKLTTKQKTALLQILKDFSEEDAIRIKAHEDRVHHDVKAVEYFLQEKCTQLHMSSLIPFIHFSLTSEDTNSCAHGLALSKANTSVLIPALTELLLELCSMAARTADCVMLARTHGQPAVPTTLGKELMVFAARLHAELTALHACTIEAKCSGAVGNWNASHFVLPDVDWPALSRSFIASLGLEPNQITTQIVPAESYSRLFQIMVRINAILIDLDRDCWQYISQGYLVQHVSKGEVGSSTMPQKVNPIDFENSEGNAGIAIALLHHFVEKLPVSRLQRDLSDSTVKRSFGTAFGHTLLALKSARRGLQKVSADSSVTMRADLDAHPEVLAEAMQTALRLQGKADAYEAVKELTRGSQHTDFIKTLHTHIHDPLLLARLAKLTPSSYTGLAETMTHQAIATIRTALQNYSSNQNKRKGKKR